MFDLATLDTKSGANEGFEVEIVNPTTLEGTGLLITVLGEDSNKNREVQAAAAARRMKRAISRRGARGLAPQLEFEEAEEEELNRLAALTKSWKMRDDKEAVVLDGKPFPCNEDNARELYERFPVIRVQVEAAIRDRSNFTQRSASN